VRIEVAPPATTLDEVDQFLVRSDRGRKRSMLETLIRSQGMTRAIIFVRTKVGASNLARHLKDRGFRASAMHGDRSQSDRVLTLEAFRAGRIHFLVATDIAARGLDVDDVSHVVNYDLPFAAGDYVHRIGRTARAGRKGMAISLVTPEDADGVEAIERLISRKLSWMDHHGMQTAPASRPASPAAGNGGPRPARSGNGKAGPPVGKARPQGIVAAATTVSRDRRQGSSGASQRSTPSRRTIALHDPSESRRQEQPRVAVVAGRERREWTPPPRQDNAEKPSGILRLMIKRVKTGLFASPGR
jgi:ATP-dependent RNA helicase RhlE